MAATSLGLLPHGSKKQRQDKKTDLLAWPWWLNGPDSFNGHFIRFLCKIHNLGRVHLSSQVNYHHLQKDDLRRVCASVCCRRSRLSNMAAALVRERLIGWWHCLALMCCTCVLLSSLPRRFQFTPCQIFFFFLHAVPDFQPIHLQKKRRTNQNKKTNKPAEFDFNATFSQVSGVQFAPRCFVSILNVLIRIQCVQI